MTISPPFGLIDWKTYFVLLIQGYSPEHKYSVVMTTETRKNCNIGKYFDTKVG